LVSRRSAPGAALDIPVARCARSGRGGTPEALPAVWSGAWHPGQAPRWSAPWRGARHPSWALRSVFWSRWPSAGGPVRRSTSRLVSVLAVPGPKIPVEALRSPCQLGRRSVGPPARRSESRYAAVFPLPALHRLRGCVTESRGGSGLARVPGDGAVSPRPTLLSHPPISAPASRRHPLAARRLWLQVGDVRWCHPLCSGCALVLSRLSGGVEGWRRLAAAVFPAPPSSS
jgi:hypothetical protein